MKRVFLTLTAIAACMLAFPARAQERVTTGAQDAQATIEAIAAELKASTTNNAATLASIKALNANLDALAACGRNKQFWNGTTCLDLPAQNTPKVTLGNPAKPCGQLVVSQNTRGGSAYISGQTACGRVNLAGNGNGISNCPQGGISLLSQLDEGVNITTQTKQVCTPVRTRQGWSQSCKAMPITTTEGMQTKTFTCMVSN